MSIGQSLRASLGSGLSRMAFFIGGGSGYDSANHDTSEMEGWTPPSTYGDGMTPSEQDTQVSRAQDADRNFAWIKGGLDRRVETVVGNNIRLSAQPKAKLLGRDAKWRMEWTAHVESLFDVWANDIHRRCDARKRMSFGAMTALAYLHYIRDGEVLAEVRMSPRGGRFNTNVMLIDSARLSNPNNGPNTERLRRGIEFDANNAPVAYHVRKRHPQDATPTPDANDWTKINAYTRTGRSKVIHVFNPRRIDQSRGISSLAEAMVPAKMLDRVDRAEVEAALLSALMSVWITSDATTDDVEDMIAPASNSKKTDSVGFMKKLMTARTKNPVRLAGAAIRHLLPGEKPMFTASRSNANYKDFQATILKKIASAIGISYPQLSQDWAGINYSSARALLNEMWRSFLQDRHFFTQAFCSPIYAAWLEEGVALGEIEMPGGVTEFYRLKTEIAACEWLGPSRGSVDPKKEADANNLDTAAGRVSPWQLILESGRNPIDVISETKAFYALWDEAGLPPLNLNVKPGDTGTDEGDSAGTTEDRDGDGVPNEGKDNQPKRQRENA